MLVHAIHPDWCDDGEEDDGPDGETRRLWRLDVPANIQVQLFAVPDGNGYKEPSLFIEYDVRGAGKYGDQRTHYSGKWFPVTEFELPTLLGMSVADVAHVLADMIEKVKALPCNAAYL